MRVVTDRSGSSADLALQVEPEHTAAQVCEVLAAQFGGAADGPLAVWQRDRWHVADDSMTVESIGLIDGDTVTALQAPAALSHPVSNGEVRVAITFGPDAGTAFELDTGRHVVGRSSQASVQLTDSLVSRHQFDLVIEAGGSVRITPNVAASNPTKVDGEVIDEEIELIVGQVIQVGATRLRVRAALPAAHAGASFGEIGFQRTPYFRLPLVSETIAALGKLPEKPKPRPLTLLTAMLPMVMGVAMVFILGNMRYLLFAAFSPVFAIGSWYDSRKQGGREYDAAVDKFEGRLEQRCDEVAAALRAERERRLHNNPDLELLARRVDSQHNELWQRDRHAPDFLSLRVGVGSGTPHVEIKPESSGDEMYQERVTDAMARFASLSDIPVAVNLAELGTLAAVGVANDVTALASALVVQATCLHSPEDIVVMAATHRDRSFAEWLKWLPHTRASSSPIAGSLLAEDREQAENLVRAVTKVAEARVAQQNHSLDRRWPWMLVLIDDELRLDPSVVSKLLDLGAEAGVSVVWMTDSHATVPRQAEVVIDCRAIRSAELSTVRFTDPERETIELDTERLGTTVAGSIARSLAPMRDATAANAVTSIPRTVTLFDSLGVSSIEASWVAKQWQTERGYSLPAPVGSTDTGAMQLDLVEHGPHGLIGGTSGAGKSELVQSLVVNLAAMNAPDKLNFLFVDYKGGALSEMFRDIPHTVGAVTNLDALLALRALTSLTAELDRRMELFKGRAPDIRTMIERFPDEAPASLVIVVDEFAALVRELPEFIDGVVSIAERGRSLGIHLLMSTQRPSGAINDNIQQNTNLRIALRMLDASESSNVINAPDAAMIPGPLKGRGLARLGPGELIPFQSAWSGAPLLAEAGPPPVLVAPFHATHTNQSWVAATPAAESLPDVEPKTQLDATVAAICDAAETMGFVRGRAPWKEMLPARIELTALLSDLRSVATSTPGSRVTVGMIDDPAAQDQYPAAIDFSNGAVGIFGTGGAGKTTTLQTIAASAVLLDDEVGGGTVTIFALDFASRGMGLVSRLPQTSAVATSDDLEAVTRILSLVERQLARRQGLLAAAVANGEAAPAFSTILLLIDGWDNLMQLFEGRSPTHNLALWSELAERLVVEGRQYGINVALSAYRRASLRSAARSTMGTQIVLRQAEEAAYVDLGISSKVASGLNLAPGQAFINDQMVQIACVSAREAEAIGNDDPSDADAFISLAQTLTGRVAPELATACLPESAPMRPHTDQQPSQVALGVADGSLRPVTLDIAHNNVAVVGPPRSGRSTTLCTIGQHCIDAGWQVWAVGSSGSPLRTLTNVHRNSFGRAADVSELLDELAEQAIATPTTPRLLLHDDVDLFDDRSVSAALETAIAEGVRIVGVLSSMRAYGSNPLFDELKRARTIVLLRPEGPRDVQDATGVVPDLRPGLPMPPGRGVLIADRVPVVVQIANPFGPVDAPPSTGPTDDVSLMPDHATRRVPVAKAIPAGALQTKGRARFEIVLQSGERVSLNQSVLVGRRPQAEQGATVHCLPIVDRYLSASHALIDVTADDLQVTDQHSRNGTIIERAAGDTIILEPGAPATVGPGDRLHIGTSVLEIVLAGSEQLA